MMQSSPRGSTIDLDCAFRDGGGFLADPTNPRITILAPDNSSVVSNAVPAKRSTGIYRFSLSLDLASTIGIWLANWSGTIGGYGLAQQDAFEVTDIGTAARPVSTGTPSWVVGTTATIDLETRDDDGLLAAATGVSLVLVDSASAPIDVESGPTALRAGVYRCTFIVPAVLGIGSATWTATVDGIEFDAQDAFEVIPDPYGAAHPYGASIPGVQAFIPEQLISETSSPSVAQVNYFIDNIASEVGLRIGNYTTTITDVGLQGRVTAFARYVVNLGAAATAFDASYPSLSSPNASSYGNVLWSRYEAVLSELIQLVDNATPGTDPGADIPGSVGGPLVSSGPPVFWSQMEF